MRIGSACKLLDVDGNNIESANLKTTTARALSSLSATDRFEKLDDLVEFNLKALRNQIRAIGELPMHLRMWRIGSDLLPLFTHSITREYYSDSDVQSVIHRKLLKIGEFARKRKIRLSFHPGQFVVLASQNLGVRESSMRELEYHCDCFTMMGYSGWHPDGLAVNVHVGVKNAAISEMKRSIANAQTNVKNFLTLENDEFSWSAEQIVNTFGSRIPLVLDVHHYWIHHGHYLAFDSSLVRDIADTWQGVQPKLHLAMSDPDLCLDAKPTSTLVLDELLGYTTKAKLRAHSQTAWHTRSIKYAAQFGFDIMWEGKDKNLGALTIAKHLDLID